MGADLKPTAEFPDLERLEDIWSRLEGLRGVLGVLTVALDGVDNLGTDIPQAVFSVSYSLNDTRQNLSAFMDDLSAFKRAQEVRA